MSLFLKNESSKIFGGKTLQCNRINEDLSHWQVPNTIDDIKNIILNNLDTKYQRRIFIGDNTNGAYYCGDGVSLYDVLSNDNNEPMLLIRPRSSSGFGKMMNILKATQNDTGNTRAVDVDNMLQGAFTKKFLSSLPEGFPQYDEATQSPSEYLGLLIKHILCQYGFNAKNDIRYRVSGKVIKVKGTLDDFEIVEKSGGAEGVKFEHSCVAHIKDLYNNILLNKECWKGQNGFKEWKKYLEQYKDTDITGSADGRATKLGLTNDANIQSFISGSYNYMSSVKEDNTGLVDDVSVLSNGNKIVGLSNKKGKGYFLMQISLGGKNTFQKSLDDTGNIKNHGKFQLMWAVLGLPSDHNANKMDEDAAYEIPLLRKAFTSYLLKLADKGEAESIDIVGGTELINKYISRAQDVTKNMIKSALRTYGDGSSIDPTKGYLMCIVHKDINDNDFVNVNPSDWEIWDANEYAQRYIQNAKFVENSFNVTKSGFSITYNIEGEPYILKIGIRNGMGKGNPAIRYDFLLQNKKSK